MRVHPSISNCELHKKAPVMDILCAFTGQLHQLCDTDIKSLGHGGYGPISPCNHIE
jgi:hypothetical protein